MVEIILKSPNVDHLVHAAIKTHPRQSCLYVILWVSMWESEWEFEKEFDLLLCLWVELVSKESDHFGGIASFFRDWAPRTGGQ